jgi:hypothetical protein
MRGLVDAERLRRFLRELAGEGDACQGLLSD